MNESTLVQSLSRVGTELKILEGIHSGKKSNKFKTCDKCFLTCELLVET